MELSLKKGVIYALVIVSPLHVFCQKVRVGYDKGADFLKFRTYTWTAPTMPTTRPFLYASIVETIDHELKAKGLTRTECDGDLVLTPAGGMEFGLNVAMGTPILPTYGGGPHKR